MSSNECGARVTNWGKTPPTSLFDPPPQMQPIPTMGLPVPCQMSRGELQSLLERAEFGRNEMVFDSYFRRSAVPGGPPVCSSCNNPIAEHRENDIVTAQIDPNVLPKGMKRDGMIDYFEGKYMMFFVAVSAMTFVMAIVMLIIFVGTGTTSSGPAFVGPCILIFMGTIFSAFPEKITATFDRSRRVWSAKKVKIIWRCWHEEHSGRFEDVTGISIENTNISVNHQPILRIGMQVQHVQGLVPLQDVRVGEMTGAQESWNLYINSNVRKPMY